ncbi:MAG: DUF3108 domain-containing protein [Candidatus Stygibacter australis]|nr:DUF3108 domain-containing protein [Candidatus Stygibacter australis]MDP8321160.1 DUF3108 domain-containing protein [Candidatus Stygibacter australis]
MKNIILTFILFLSLYCQAGFGAGEELNFDISYGIITAGSVNMLVEKGVNQDSIPVYKVTSRAKTTSFFDRLYKVRDLIEIEFSQNDFQTFRYHKKLREGSYRQNRINLYYPNLGYANYLRYHRKPKKWSDRRYDIPVPSHDIFTTFFKVRTLEFAVGDTIQATVAEDAKITIVNILIKRIKKIDTIFGDIDCYELEPQLRGTDSIFKQSGDIFIYLTADEEKIPVLLKSEVIFGSFRATLKNYKPAAINQP